MQDEIDALLGSIQDGTLSAEEGARRLRSRTTRAGGPSLELGHSTLDLERADRCGHPEVIFGAGKSPDELVDVARALTEAHGRVLATRVDAAGQSALRAAFGSDVVIDERGRTAHTGDLPPGIGSIAIVSAGTSDGAVAREAETTARFLGAAVTTHRDVGVAGIHRTFAVLPDLRAALVVVVVAGMEGALPSVIGGLVDRPVIAVPTSVGYGASFGGLSALLGMLNSCASGVTVVNIDNGFGAGFAAARINAAIVRGPAQGGEMA